MLVIYTFFKKLIHSIPCWLFYFRARTSLHHRPHTFRLISDWLDEWTLVAYYYLKEWNECKKQLGSWMDGHHHFLIITVEHFCSWTSDNLRLVLLWIQTIFIKTSQCKQINQTIPIYKAAFLAASQTIRNILSSTPAAPGNTAHLEIHPLHKRWRGLAIKPQREKHTLNLSSQILSRYSSFDLCQSLNSN